MSKSATVASTSSAAASTNTSAFAASTPLHNVSTTRNGRTTVCAMRRRTSMAIAVGARVRVKADIEIYTVKGQFGVPHNVKNCEGVVAKNVMEKYGEKYTATKPYVVQCEEPKFSAHFDEDELEFVE